MRASERLSGGKGFGLAADGTDGSGCRDEAPGEQGHDDQARSGEQQGQGPFGEGVGAGQDVVRGGQRPGGVREQVRALEPTIARPVPSSPAGVRGTTRVPAARRRGCRGRRPASPRARVRARGSAGCVKATAGSMSSRAMWSSRKPRATAPSHRCRSSSRMGGASRPSTWVRSRMPHRTTAVSRPQAVTPLARIASQVHGMSATARLLLHAQCALVGHEDRRQAVLRAARLPHPQGPAAGRLSPTIRQCRRSSPRR